MVNDTLKEAIYETIHHSRVPLKAISDEIGLAESTINRWGLPDDDPDSSGSRMPLKYLVHLIQITKNDRIIQYLYRKLGGVFVRPPAVKTTDDDLKTILMAQKKVADWIRLQAEAMLDGTITEEELCKITLKGDEIMVYNEQLKMILAQREGRAA